MMRKSLTFLLLLMAAGPAMAADVKLKTSMSGADADGAGTAEVTVNPATGQVCYSLEVSNIDTPLAAHIHKGAEGKGGPPVVTLDAPANGKSKGCATVGADVATAIVADPAGYYVNVHTAPHPGGAIRGQLGK